MNVLLFLILMTDTSFSQVEIKRRTQRMPVKKIEQVVQVKQSKVAVVEDNSELDKIDEFIRRASHQPAIWDLSRRFTIKSTTTLKGRLLNSVVSTNLESPLVVQVVQENDFLPAGTLFSCRGSTKHKRVFSACNKLVLPDSNGDEFPVVASILNMDGSAGIKADYFYSGKEELVAGVLASAMVRGVIETSQQRIATPLGQVTPDTVKNRYLNGALSTTDELTNLMEREMRTKEPKAYIEAGKNVLIYFNERFEI